jgi:reverse gyrase
LKEVLQFEEELVLPKGKAPVAVRSALLVVESPTKARTIARILGGGSAISLAGGKVYQAAVKVKDEVLFLFIVATKGHLFDLTVDPIGLYGVHVGERIVPVYGPVNRCKECSYSWSGSPDPCPRCGGKAESSLVRIETLRKLAYLVDAVIVASDPDEEGEKIAWDVEAMVKPFNKDVKRAKYYEVTRRGILEALSNLGDIDYGVVKSQIVRRIDDRVVGFELSQRLWNKFDSRNLGIGRVQGPVLKWAVEAKAKWESSKGYAITLKLENGDKIVLFKENKDEAEKIASLKEVEVVAIEEVIKAVPPLPPLTTDELLKEASLKGISPKGAMSAAQRLFEQGLITYHRTDSTRVSDVGIAVAKEWITNNFGQDEFFPRRWGEGGAHEAIRPTKPLDVKELLSAVATGSVNAKLDKLQIKVYSIVFERFISSQMKEAKIKYIKVRYKVFNDIIEKEHLAEILEPGWSRIRPVKLFGGKLEPGNVKVVSSTIRRASKFKLPSTGELIKRMREVGIGRPSTYTRTIEALRRHGYIVLSKYKGLVVATKRGFKVLEYLEELMPELLSESYTRSLEELMDQAPDRYEEILEDIVGKVWKVREAETGTLLS